MIESPKLGEVAMNKIVPWDKRNKKPKCCNRPNASPQEKKFCACDSGSYRRRPIPEPTPG